MQEYLKNKFDENRLTKIKNLASNGIARHYIDTDWYMDWVLSLNPYRCHFVSIDKNELVIRIKIM